MLIKLKVFRSCVWRCAVGEALRSSLRRMGCRLWLPSHLKKKWAVTWFYRGIFFEPLFSEDMKLIWPDYRDHLSSYRSKGFVFSSFCYIRSDDKNFPSCLIFMFKEYFFHIFTMGCHIHPLNVTLVWHKHCKQRVDHPLSFVLKNKICQSAPPKLKMCVYFLHMRWYTERRTVSHGLVR